MNDRQGLWRDEEWELIATLSGARALAKYRADLRKAWRVFADGGVPEALRSAIHASWQRSRSAGIDPDSFRYVRPGAARLREILESHSELIAIARDVMENLLAYNPDGHINLTSAEGVTLSFCGQNLTPVGSILSESVQGTNCTGRCLVEGRLVYLLSEENYKQALRDRGKHCAAAPIRDEGGELLGVLTLTANSGAFHYHTLGTVQAAAEAIARQLTLRRLLDQQKSILEAINEGVIVTGDSGRIRELNHYARKVLGVSDAVKYRDIDQVLKPVSGTIKGIEACRDRTVTFSPTGKARIECLISVTPGADGGKVISLREQRRIRDIARRVIGGGASYTFDMIVGQSAALQSCLQLARAAAGSESTVLLSGESGTGKELFAQSIHNASARQTAPFLAVNCGAIPRDLVQSELFGYEDGAFTGSRRGGAAGKFELADGGTLFLDEIGDMPLEAQASLLRVLQEGEVLRIGGRSPLSVNVRVIAATHRDLQQEVESGAFRRDLYFRLNVINIAIPALRRRKEDIPALAALFCRKVSDVLQRPLPVLTPQALMRLTEYHWPGNIRELENIIERTLNIYPGDVVGCDALPDPIGRASPTAPPGQEKALRSLDDNERQHIEACLRLHRGNLRQAALALQLSRGALYNKIKKYAIDPNEYRRYGSVI